MDQRWSMRSVLPRGWTAEECFVYLLLSGGPGGPGLFGEGQQHGASAPGECVMGFWNHDDDDTEIDETDDEFAEDDESEDEGEDDDEPDAEEDDGLHERVEEAFRVDRRAIRASNDAGELREKSAELERAILNGRMPGIAGVRARDLIELIDDRLTELRSGRSR